jgi:hypothetical protein
MAKGLIPKISIIMPFCSNDYRFLRPNIKQLLKFTKSVYIVYSDHFWNGQPEDNKIIERSISENPKAKFINVPYVNKNPPIPKFICRMIPKRFLFRPVYGPRYFEGLVRWKGYLEAKKSNPDYYIFLDVDEIVEGKRFKSWLQKGLDKRLNAMIFHSYEYLKSPRYQAKKWSLKGVLVKKREIAKKDFFTYRIRKRFYETTPDPKEKGIVGLDNKPMVHHYSLTRKKNNLLKKIEITSINGLSLQKIMTIRKKQSQSYNLVEPFIDLQ